jgi:hypothetical protein
MFLFASIGSLIIACCVTHFNFTNSTELDNNVTPSGFAEYIQSSFVCNNVAPAELLNIFNHHTHPAKLLVSQACFIESTPIIFLYTNIILRPPPGFAEYFRVNFVV